MGGSPALGIWKLLAFGSENYPSCPAPVLTDVVPSLRRASLCQAGGENCRVVRGFHEVGLQKERISPRWLQPAAARNAVGGNSGSHSPSGPWKSRPRCPAARRPPALLSGSDGLERPCSPLLSLCPHGTNVPPPPSPRVSGPGQQHMGTHTCTQAGALVREEEAQAFTPGQGHVWPWDPLTNGTHLWEK